MSGSPGYTEEEKVEIAKRYLVKRQLAAMGLTTDQVEITEDAIRAIIRDYTREAGVRNLEREIGPILHHVAMRVAEGAEPHMKIEAKDLHGILGAGRFESEVAMRTSVPGVATGLAWTPSGGDILFVEAARVPGSGRLILTGQLGDVMKESAAGRAQPRQGARLHARRRSGIVRNAVGFVWLSTVDDAIAAALESPPASEPRQAPVLSDDQRRAAAG